MLWGGLSFKGKKKKKKKGGGRDVNKGWGWREGKLKKKKKKKKEREERLAEERISKITQRTKQGRKTRDVASGEKS